MFSLARLDESGTPPGGSRQIYYSAAAQEDNLGDVVIRRTVLEWITSSTEEVHVYRGGMSDSYIAALGAPASVTFHDSARSFTSAWLRSCGRRQAALVYAPGPRTAKRTLSSSKSAATMLAMTDMTRLSGGPVVAVGGALRGEPSLALQLHRRVVKSSSHYSVRDSQSWSLLNGSASVVPDVAFAEAKPSVGTLEEPVLAISLRFDRPADLTTLRALVTIARTMGVQPIIVTQVKRDQQNHQRLADELDIELCGWTVEDHLEQLERIERIYRRTSIVFSDRLHSCILGGGFGAAIIDAGAEKSDKLKSTLSVVYSADGSITRPPAVSSQTELSAQLNGLMANRRANCRKVQVATHRLRIEREQCVGLLLGDNRGNLAGHSIDSGRITSPAAGSLDD